MIAVHPLQPSSDLIAALRAAGHDWEPVNDAAALGDDEPARWSLLIVELGDDPIPGLAAARRVKLGTSIPVIVVAPRTGIGELDDAVCDDFLLSPVDPTELNLRINRIVSTPDTTAADEIVSFKDLMLNLATYQANIAGAPVDLTYMEYELLRFFVTNPGRVWSREQLLSRVWGYDYFGGARTVDVHVRRLRSKLGEERASWIGTVRSVGYRFG